MASIEFKAQLTVSEEGEIEGIAWPFGSPDRVGDVIERGAFAKASPPLPMLASHDQKEVVGVWEDIAETDEGLRVKGRLLVDEVAKAREIRALVRAGAMRGLSIGFAALKALPRKGGGRTITALDLMEISPVAVPAHPGARILSAKDTDMTETTTETTTADLALAALTAKMTEIEKKADPAPLLAPLVARSRQGDGKLRLPLFFLRLLRAARGHGARCLGEGQGSPLLFRGGASLLRPYACGGGAGLQYSVQLLQPQIRLRQ